MNHYERLEVRRTATRAEIRAAYLRKAKVHHPDRQLEESAERRERAEIRMRALNEAWAVLRDDDRRAEYDRELARLARLEAPAPVFHPVTDAPVDDDEDDVEFVPIGREGMLLRAIPLLVLFAILFFILVFTAYAASPRP